MEKTRIFRQSFGRTKNYSWRNILRSIISSFHDYYDIGLKYTNDNDVVFLRNPVSFKLDTAPTLVKELHDKYKSYIMTYRWSYKSPYRKNGSWIDIDKTKLLVVFCGKIYPILAMHYHESYTKTITSYFYDFDSYTNYCNENSIELSDKSNSNNIRNYFNRDNIAVDVDFLITNKITIATIYNDNVLFNNNISALQFYKVFDPYQTFQELEMWLSGVLSYPQNLMIEVGNESKIEKAGFDKKWSFRKRPNK